VAGRATETPKTRGTAYCIQAGGTGAAESLTGNEVADQVDNMIYFGEMIWGTNITAKILVEDEK